MHIVSSRRYLIALASEIDRLWIERQNESKSNKIMNNKKAHGKLSSAEKKERIIGALLSAELQDPVLEDEIRAWLRNDIDRHEKDEILAGLFDSHYTGATSADEETLKRLVELKKRLGMPIPEYEVRNGAIDILTYKKGKRERLVPLRRWGIKAAAVLLPIVILMGIRWLLPEKTEQPRPEVVQEVRISTDDVRQEFELPDSSSVRIAPQSELRYAAAFEGQRLVKLTGEAHFKVTKAQTEDDRFTVRTDHFNIAVLGTEFIVKSPAGDDYSTIDLYHGSIRVEAGGKEYLMKPGEHLHYCHSTRLAEITGAPVAEHHYIEMPGLVFEGESLQEVFDVLSRQYGLQIEIKGKIPDSWKSIYINLSRLHTIDEVMKTLSTITDSYAYEITKEKVIITSTE